MSEARGRQAQESAEKSTPSYRRPHPDAAAVGAGLVTGAAAGAAGLGVAVIRAHAKEKRKYPTVQERAEAAKKRRDERARSRFARATRGGGTYEVTPRMTRRRDRSKPFKLL